MIFAYRLETEWTIVQVQFQYSKIIHIQQSAILLNDLIDSKVYTYTVKILNIQTHQKFAVITLKFEQDGFTKE